MVMTIPRVIDNFENALGRQFLGRTWSQNKDQKKKKKKRKNKDVYLLINLTLCHMCKL